MACMQEGVPKLITRLQVSKSLEGFKFERLGSGRRPRSDYMGALSRAVTAHNAGPHDILQSLILLLTGANGRPADSRGQV